MRGTETRFALASRAARAVETGAVRRLFPRRRPSTAAAIREAGRRFGQELRDLAAEGGRFLEKWERHYQADRRWYDPRWADLNGRTNPRLEAARAKAIAEIQATTGPRLAKALERAQLAASGDHLFSPRFDYTIEGSR